MEKLISGNALRERLLKRLEDTLTRPHDNWVQALGPHGNRELLGLIAIQRPQSITELSEIRRSRSVECQSIFDCPDQCRTGRSQVGGPRVHSDADRSWT